MKALEDLHVEYIAVDESLADRATTRCGVRLAI